jgi:hypothetical protein
MRRKAIRNIKKFLFHFLLNKGIKNSPTTNPSRLLEFMQLIKPYTTNHQLLRIGGNADGGYLIPDDLNGISACFSPGVENTSTFESELAAKGIKSFMADYSVDSVPVKNPLFSFEKKYLGTDNNEMYTRLDTWIERCAPDKNDFLLQMDIEGAEYGVILDTAESDLAKFRIMVIEFHYVDELCNHFGFEFINLTFQKILKQFEIVHIHPNNSNKPFNFHGFDLFHAMEFTFLRKDRISTKTLTNSFPHAFDRKCVPDMPDYQLPPCWYKS